MVYRTCASLALIIFINGAVVHSLRADDSVSPYIDHLKSQMKNSSDPPSTASQPEPYIQYLKRKQENLKNEQSGSAGEQPHIDKLRAADPSLNSADKKDSDATYTEKKKQELGPDSFPSAIDAVRDGKSDLHMKRPGPVRGTIGFKIGTILNRSYNGSAPVVVNPYSTVYGGDTKWVPDITFFAEFKPFSSETWGGLGLVGTGGFSYAKGFGIFSQTLYNQGNGSASPVAFPAQSFTQLTFITIPVAVQAKYQFNLLKWLRPYGMIGPTYVGMSENRNDGIGAQKALSKGITFSIGGAILMDWLSDSSAWDLYQDFSIKHVYLTVDYTRINSVSSPVSISNSGIYGGVSFEF